MIATLRSATVAIVLTTIALGLLYPLAVTGIGQVVFPGASNGSLVKRDGKTVGSSIIGQSFQKPVLDKAGKPRVDADGNAVTEPDPKYLQPRPSATGYSGDATYFANRGPNSKVAAYAYRDAVAAVLALERPYVPGLRAGDLDDPGDGDDHRAQLDDEHHRVADLLAWVELAQRPQQRRPEDAGREHRPGLVRTGHRAGASRSSARLNSRTFTPGRPKTPSVRPSVLASIRSRTFARGMPR